MGLGGGGLGLKDCTENIYFNEIRGGGGWGGGGRGVSSQFIPVKKSITLPLCSFSLHPLGASSRTGSSFLKCPQSC